MNKAVALSADKAGAIIEAVIARGDIAQLSPEERAKYYVSVCNSVGLNPMTRPFEYITLNGKLELYARKDATDQLRALNNVSVTDLAESEREGVFIVTAKVMNSNGRTDAAKGAVTITGLKGDALANALMKAETKAKRRATLSICGLGFVLDETEIETVPAEAKIKRHKTLPKKDAKPLFTALQSEIDGATDREQFTGWFERTKERVDLLPEDWQDILRLKYEEKKAALRAAKPEITFDSAQWLRDVDGALGGCEDAITLGEINATTIIPGQGRATATDWAQAQALYADKCNELVERA